MQRLVSLQILSLAAGSLLILAMPALADTAPSAGAVNLNDSATAGSRWLARLDKNGDGVIDRQEFDASRQVIFSRLDADGNQLLSQAEWQAMQDKLHQRRRNVSNDNAAGNNPANGSTMAERGQKLFQLADKNGDQQISADEWRAMSDRMFDRLDVNKDGKLTADEMRARRGLTPVEPIP